MKNELRKSHKTFTSRLLTLLLTTVVCISFASICPVFAANPAPEELVPTDDAYIMGGSADQGIAHNGTTLMVKRTPGGANVTRKTFMKFDVSSLSSLCDSITVTDATLHLYGLRDNKTGDATVGVYQLDDNSWSETGITWLNAPSAGFDISTLIGSFIVTNTGYKAYTVDLTSYFADKIESGNDTVSIVLDDVSTDRSTTFGSKDHATASYKPSLVITYAIKTTASITNVSPISGGYQVAYNIALGSNADSSVNYVAIYNGKDLIGVRSVSDDESTIDFQTDKEVTKARLFVWDGISSIKPLCSPLEYIVNQ